MYNLQPYDLEIYKTQQEMIVKGCVPYMIIDWPRSIRVECPRCGWLHELRLMQPEGEEPYILHTEATAGGGCTQVRDYAKRHGFVSSSGPDGKP